MAACKTNFGYAMRKTFRRGFRCLLFLALFNYAYHVFIFTLGQFSAYQFDRQLVFHFLFSYRLPDGHCRRLVLHRLPLFLPITSLLFVLNHRRAASAKPGMASGSRVERLAIGKPNAPPSTPISQPDHRLSSCQTKPPVLLGSRKSISERDVVSETIKGISDFGHFLVDCFEFESDLPSIIPIVKGRFRAHYNFWSQTS